MFLCTSNNLQVYDLYTVFTVFSRLIQHLSPLPKKLPYSLSSKTLFMHAGHNRATISQRMDQRNIPTFPEGDILIFVMSTWEYLSSNSFSSRIVSGSP